MPIADVLVDAVANNRILTFMDGYSVYNQIYFVKEDIHKTMFCYPGSIGIFEYCHATRTKNLSKGNESYTP